MCVSIVFVRLLCLSSSPLDNGAVALAQDPEMVLGDWEHGRPWARLMVILGLVTFQ